MEQVLTKIKQADQTEIEPLLKAVLNRYADLFPEWEICTVSTNKTQDRTKQIDMIIQMLEKMKTSSF